jgi:heme-degrading monooxygenase HmoA
MYARITRLEAPASGFDDGVAQVNAEVIPAVKGLDGFAGAYFLGDRATGALVSVVLWDTEEQMKASEDAAERIRGSAAQSAQGTIQSVERYEVIAQA